MVNEQQIIGETVIDTVKDTILSFLKSFCSQQDKFTYSKDPKTTEVWIMDQFSYNLSDKNQNLSIVVRRGQMTYRASSMNRIMEQTQSGDRRIKSDLFTGSFILTVIGRDGLESEILACRIFGAIIAHQEEIKKIGNLHAIGMTMASVGEETAVASDTKTELMEVPIILDFAKQYSIYIEDREGQPLTNIGLEVNANP